MSRFRNPWWMLFAVLFVVLCAGTFVALTAQLILVAPWQGVGWWPSLSPRTAALPGIALIAIFTLPVFRWGWNDLNKHRHSLGATWSRADAGALTLVLLTALILWSVYAAPVADRPPNTFGDEDAHYLIAKEYAQWYGALVSGESFDRTPRYFFQRPGAMHTWYALFHDTTGSQRRAMLWPFLATALIAFLGTRLITHNRRFATGIGLLAATSPLLLAYTMDRYLDIGHPPLFLAAGFAGWLALQRSRPAALTVLACCAALLPLIKHNLYPTTLLLAGWIALVALSHWKSPKALARHVHAFFLATVPPTLIYLVISNFNRLDADRLSIYNIKLQRYDLLALHTPLYLPLLVILAPLALILLGRKPWKTLFALPTWFPIVLFASMAIQLLAYAVFQPVWMPWSRNYVMFWCQPLLLTIVALSLPTFRNWLNHRSLLALLTVSLIVQLGVGFRELKRNVVFHENEVWYDFPSLWDAIESGPAQEIGMQPVYMNAPLYPPLAQRVPQPPPIQLHWVTPPEQQLIEDRLIDWDAFTALLPADAEWALFHYHDFRNRMAKLHTWRIPPPDQTPGWEKITEIVDPLSEGHAGVILYRRTATKKQRSDALPPDHPDSL